jgi:hypothetical protein
MLQMLTCVHARACAIWAPASRRLHLLITIYSDYYDFSLASDVLPLTANEMIVQHPYKAYATCCILFAE